MKAILVIDMPIDCLECPFYDDMLMRCGYLKNEHYGVDARPSDCPLKPMPKQKYDTVETCYYAEPEKKWYELNGYSRGWNACLEEIEK